MTAVLLLGAGFSKWAANLPIARQLFDFEIVPFGPREATKLERLRRAKAWWDASRPPDQAEQFIAHAIASGGELKKLVLWYVQRRLVAPYIWEEWHVGRLRRHVLQIDERRVDSRPGVGSVRAFLAKCNPEAIVTLNYDMLVEYALGTKRFHYGHHGERLTGRGPYPVSQWMRPVSLTGAIPLAKLHGSISWDSDGRYADGRRGLSGLAQIVAPIPEKTAPPELSNVWALARTALQRARRAIVFGMAFNPYDGAVLSLLRERADIAMESVLLIDPAPKIDAARELWPSARIEVAMPPPDGDEAISRWLRGGSGVNDAPAVSP